jgi:putative membrane protein
MADKPYDDIKEELILRDHLAIDRTTLANERNLLAYIRTSIAFVAGGLAILRYITNTMGLTFGIILITVGGFVLVFGIYRFIKFRLKITDINCVCKTDTQEKEKK